MASLEDRLKQHYIYPYDPEYVAELNKEGYDPHLDIAVLAGMLTQEQSDAYKAGDKRYKPVRDIAKNGNYSCQYGAGPPRIAVTAGISVEQARVVHTAYWERNWAIKKVASVQTFKEVREQLWLRNPLNGFWYSLRYEKDIFSTLVQGSASYCFDIWLMFIRKRRPQLTATFHDEIVLNVKKDFQEQIKAFLFECIDQTNQFLNLNRELGIDVQFGHKYSDIH